MHNRGKGYRVANGHGTTRSAKVVARKPDLMLSTTGSLDCREACAAGAGVRPGLHKVSYL